MNTPRTYAQLFSILKTWFMSRGGDILCDDSTLMDYINLAIQDLYNEDNATRRHVTEKLEGKVEGDHVEYESKFPIHKIQKAYKINTNGYVDTNEANNLIPTLFTLDTDNIQFSGTGITTHKTVTKIQVTYLMDYVYVSSSDKDKKVPIPSRYYPAILKMAFDWAAPINLMSGEVSTTDFYSHGITRINKVAANDSLTDFIDMKPAYN